MSIKRELYRAHCFKWQTIINKVVQTCTVQTTCTFFFPDTLNSLKYDFFLFVPGFYTGWLLPAAMVGLGVFLYGLFTLDHNVSAREVCSLEAKK